MSRDQSIQEEGPELYYINQEKLGQVSCLFMCDPHQTNKVDLDAYCITDIESCRRCSLDRPNLRSNQCLFLHFVIVLEHNNPK